MIYILICYIVLSILVFAILALLVSEKKYPTVIWTNQDASMDEWLYEPKCLVTRVNYVGKRFLPIAVIMMPNGEIKTIYTERRNEGNQNTTSYPVTKQN